MRRDLMLIPIFLDRASVSCMNNSCTYINGQALAGTCTIHTVLWNAHKELEMKGEITSRYRATRIVRRWQI